MIDTDIEMLRIADEDDLKTFVANNWGILEPSLDSLSRRENLLPMNPDFVCVVNPGLAFDLHRNRLGKGKGYYDRFLVKLGKVAKFKTLAVALKCQIVDSVPVEDYDVKMDEIILEDREIK
jgi:5-formyltetrahydrofolate cyclo-ligase